MLDGNKIVFVDQENGAPKTLTVSQLQRDLEAQRLQVVNEHPVAFEQPAKSEVRLVQTVEDLPEKVQQEMLHRLRYVKHCLRVGLRSGMRAGIEAALAKLGGVHPVSASDKPLDVAFTPPRASTLMSWMKAFALSGGNPLSLISRHGFRSSPKRVNPKVIQIARAQIRNFYCSRRRPTAQQTKGQIDKFLEDEVARGQLNAEEAKISDSTLRRLILDCWRSHRTDPVGMRTISWTTWR